MKRRDIPSSSKIVAVLATLSRKMEYLYAS